MNNNKGKIASKNKRKTRQKKETTKIDDEKWELPSFNNNNKKKDSDDSDDELKNLGENIDLSSAYVRSIVNKNKKENVLPEVDRSWIISTRDYIDVDSDPSGFTVVQKVNKIIQILINNISSLFT